MMSERKRGKSGLGRHTTRSRPLFLFTPPLPTSCLISPFVLLTEAWNRLEWCRLNGWDDTEDDKSLQHDESTDDWNLKVFAWHTLRLQKVFGHITKSCPRKRPDCDRNSNTCGCVAEFYRLICYNFCLKAWNNLNEIEKKIHWKHKYLNDLCLWGNMCRNFCRVLLQKIREAFLKLFGMPS